MSVGKIFVDTNVLIYAYDVSSGVKHARAAELVTQTWKFRAGHRWRKSAALVPDNSVAVD